MKKKISSLFYGVATFVMLMCVTFIYSCSKDDNNSTDGGGGGDDIPDDEIVVSEDYMPLEDYEYSVELADTAAGVYTLSFADGTPDVQSGDVVQIDMDTVVQLVRVLSVEDAGGNVTLRTEPADLCDIFISGSFTLSTEGMAEAKTRGAGESGNVFYPSSITFYDENDRKHTVDFTDGTRGGFEKRLYSQSIDLSGYTIAKTEHTRIYLETCTFDLDLNLVMEYNFEELKEGWRKYRRGELVLHKSAVRGSIDTDFKIRFDAQGEASQDLCEICLKRNIHKPVMVKFLAAGVPVVVVMNTNLYGDGCYDVSGSFSAHTGFATSTDVELGFSWAQGDDSLKHYADFNSDITWHKPTVEGSTHLESEVYVYPRINFAVYGLLGPAFDIKPYLRQTLDLGFYDQLGSSPKDFYGATCNMFVGYDAAVSLTFVPTIFTKPIAKSPSWNVCDKQIYEGPVKLEYASEDLPEVKPNESYRLDFLVRDLNMLTSNEVLPTLPWAVKFVTNCGTLSSDFVTTNCFTGLASVDWTPSSSTTDGADPYVVAIIHNNEGGEIASDRIITKLEEGQNRTFNVGGVEFTMVYVEGGTFMMGSNDADENWCKPVHQVTLSDYYIGETEVTQALWKAVMDSNPSYHKGDNLPVEMVSWDDCQDFIGRLNKITGENFRLPTEAQWEFAARGGNYSNGYKYSGSNNPDAVAWYSENSNEKSHPVGTKQANELGIYDMSGNVSEWCRDWFGSYFSAAVTDPTGPSSGSGRVCRGYSIYYYSICSCTNRSYEYPAVALDDLGLRLALK